MIKRKLTLIVSLVILLQNCLFGYAAEINDGGTMITEGVYSIYAEIDQSKALGVPATLDENSVALELMDYQGKDSQKFEIYLMDDGCYSITSIYSGMFLAYEGENIYLTDSIEANQKWRIETDNNGSCIIYTSDEKKCIAVSQSDEGCDIQLEEISGDISQKFILDIQNEQTQQTEIVEDDYINEDIPEISEISNIEEKVEFNVNTQTPSLEDGIYMIHTKLNLSKAIDVHGVSLEVGANVELYESNSGLNQQFVIKALKSGYYSITAMHSNLLLTVDGDNVCQSNLTGDENQKWRIEENPDGSYVIYLADTTKCMDVPWANAVDEANIQVYEYNGGDNQSFVLDRLGEMPEYNEPDTDIGEGNEEENIAVLEDGIYTIATKLDSSKLLDVHMVSLESGANVELYERNGGMNQQFVIRVLGDGYYSITAMHSDLDLTVENDNVCQAYSTADINQKWRIKEDSDGNFVLYIADTTKCIDVPWADAVNGANIQVYEYNGGDNQRFILNLLEKIPESDDIQDDKTIEEGIYTICSALNSSKVLDVHGVFVESETNIELYEYNGGGNQQFEIKDLGNGQYSITAKHSGMAVTVDGYNVCQSYPMGSNNQKWKIEKSVNGNYTIYTADRSKCMTVEGGMAVNTANVQVTSYQNKSSQQFILKKTAEIIEQQEKDFVEGTYIISTVLQDNSIFDIFESSEYKGAKVLLQEKNEKRSQKFVIKKLENGNYSIISKNSGMSLVIGEDGVVRQDFINGEYEGWILQHVIDNCYKLVDATTGRSISVDNNGNTNEKVTASYDDASAQQVFELSRVNEDISYPVLENGKKLEEGIYTIHSLLDNTKVLDVAEGGLEDGASVILFSKNGGKNQEFIVREIDNEEYIIIARCSGKAVVSEEKIFQKVYEESTVETWKIVPVGGGYYAIISNEKNKCLETFSTNSINNLRIEKKEYYKAQLFRFQEVQEETPVVINECQIGRNVEDNRSFIKINAESAYKQDSADNKYYVVQIESYGDEIEQKFKPVAIEKDYDISVKLMLEGTKTENKSKIMGKYALAVLTNNGEYRLVSKPVSISNLQTFAANTAPIFKGTSKKGLQGVAYASDSNNPMPVDARYTNTKQTLINLDLATVVSRIPKSGYSAYSYKGNTYYFSDLVDLKANIKSLNFGYKQYLYENSGRTPVAVTLCLLLSYNEENSFLIDPAARASGHAYYTLNVREEYARETLEALFFYLGETFGQSDCYVSNWILGNEINSSKAWNYSGSLDFNTYMDCYATAFRMLYTAVKCEKTGNTVSISLDNGWATAPDTYAGKVTLDTFAQKIHEQNSNIDWSIAYHPYSYPLTRGDFWNDYSNTTDSLYTPYISMRNITVLTNYASTLESMYGKNGGSIRVLLTEQGYSYSAGAETQAMAIARGYYIAEFNDRIDAFIIRAVSDDKDEASGRLYFGLMNSQQDKRIAFYVYEYMDSMRRGFSAESSSVVSDENRYKFEKAKSIVCDTNWSSIISGFDDSKLTAIK